MPEKIKCDVCGKEFSKHGIKGHIWRQHTPEGIAFKPSSGKSYPAWNKGLTKETDERIKKHGELLSDRFRNGEILLGGFCSQEFQSYMKTDEYKEEQSKRMKKVVLDNPESYDKKNVSGRVKNINVILGDVEYTFKGSWEVSVARFLFENKIEFTNIVEPIQYFWKESGKIHLYFPDFYLPQYDKYIEVKGFKTARDEDKWSVLSGKLIVFQNKEIIEINKDKFNLCNFLEWLG